MSKQVAPVRSLMRLNESLADYCNKSEDLFARRLPVILEHFGVLAMRRDDYEYRKFSPESIRAAARNSVLAFNRRYYENLLRAVEAYQLVSTYAFT